MLQYLCLIELFLIILSRWCADEAAQLDGLFESSVRESGTKPRTAKRVRRGTRRVTRKVSGRKRVMGKRRFSSVQLKTTRLSDRGRKHFPRVGRRPPTRRSLREGVRVVPDATTQRVLHSSLQHFRQLTKSR